MSGSYESNLNLSYRETSFIKTLSNFVSTESFDTEAMDMDFQIETGGNIANTIKDEQSTYYIKNMFEKSASYEQ